jgi:hypothetical protein
MTEEEEKKLARLEKRFVENDDFRRPSSQHIGFWHGYLLHIGTPRLGAILQRSVGKHPQGILLGNSHDHGAYP